MDGLTYCVGIATHLHLSDLLPRPIRVQLRGPHKGQMYAQRAMNPAAIDANEDPVRDTGPRWVFSVAIEAHLKRGSRSQLTANSAKSKRD